MTSFLLLRGIAGDATDRHRLDRAEEAALAPAFRDLVAFVAPAEQGAIAHELDGEIVAAWTREGAQRLAQLLPPAYENLSALIRERHQEGTEQRELR